MKQYCEYEVLDFETGLVLIHGSKFKDFGERFETVPDNLIVFFRNDRPCSAYCSLGSFNESIFSSNIITCFVGFIRIKQRDCLIVYYLHSKPSKKLTKRIVNFVLSTGKLLHIAGRQYLNVTANSIEVIEEFLKYNPDYKKYRLFDKMFEVK